MVIRSLATAVVISALVIPLTPAPADGAAPVRITRVQYNSPGSDTGTNASLDAEWVLITNHGYRTRALTGWRLRDRVGHRFSFPSFTLKPGASVRVHTGKGRDTRTDVYWGKAWYVWNNTGDRATLKNKAGRTVDTCTWGDGSGVKSC